VIPGQKSLGVVAVQVFETGEPVVCYGGYIRDDDATLADDETYLFDLEMEHYGYKGNTLFIDGTRSIAGKINDPWTPPGLAKRQANLQPVLLFDAVSQTPQIVLFATRRIEKDEELLYKYGIQYWKVMWKRLVSEHARFTAKASLHIRKLKVLLGLDDMDDDTSDDKSSSSSSSKRSSTASVGTPTKKEEELPPLVANQPQAVVEPVAKVEVPANAIDLTGDSEGDEEEDHKPSATFGRVKVEHAETSEFDLHHCFFRFRQPGKEEKVDVTAVEDLPKKFTGQDVVQFAMRKGNRIKSPVFHFENEARVYEGKAVLFYSMEGDGPVFDRKHFRTLPHATLLSYFTKDRTRVVLM